MTLNYRGDAARMRGQLIKTKIIVCNNPLPYIC